MATTYTADEVDELLSRTKAEISNAIKNVITMSEKEAKPSADDTSVWLQVEEVSDKTNASYDYSDNDNP